ncbi:MAG: fibronectin type III domain-containing protein, partial [Nitrospirae bacterium]|nr:fibronectin type III domain-containing protein [Nitrospirota bacterium]
LPVPQTASSRGGVRSVFIDIAPDSSEAVESYTVLRGRTESGSYQEVGKVENSSRHVSFEDRNLLDAETYHYKVVGRGRSGMTTVPSQPIRVATAGPPDAVTGLSAQSGLIRKVILQWQASFDPNVKGYNVYRRTSGDTWAKIKTLDGQSRASYADEGLDDEKTYTYRIAAFNVVETESSPSRTAAATTKGPPSPVTGLKAASGEARKVSLSWNPVNEPEVKGYAVYRASQETGPFETIKSIEGREQTQFVDGGKKGYFSDDAGLQDETRYYYKVRAVNVVDVQSPESRAAIAVTKPVPTPVTGIRTGEFEVKQVTVEWEPNPEPDIAKYEVFRGEEQASVNKSLGEIPGSAYRFVDKGLKDGTTYHYKVRAVDKDGLIGKFSIAVRSSTKPLPRNPRGIKAAFDGGQVIVSWAPNPEPDIVKYAVSQKGFMFWDKAGESNGPSFAFRGEVKKGKTLTFRVTAV